MAGAASRLISATSKSRRLQQPTMPVDLSSIDTDKLSSEITAAWLHCRQAVRAGDKSAIRKLHLRAKASDSQVNYLELRSNLKRFKAFFPQAAKIEPDRISPVVIPVRPRSREEELFKIMRGYWSMPYSKGYGRRLRFVVMDAFHEAVIGIIGLQSPSADLACRDEYLRIPKERKLSVINNTLDAYTVGASPAYAPLLAGKLVAGFLHSNVIRQEYWRTYSGKRTTQLNKRIPQPLLAITTASAFGRSSIYNRLKDEKKALATPLGYTKGFGTFHLEEIYPRMAEWLKLNGRHVPAGFGNGPKVRWQNIMRTLLDLGLSRNHLEHGLRREVFIFELASNLIEVCRSNATPDIPQFNDQEWSEFWKDRWCKPRAQRNPDWYLFDPYYDLSHALNP